MIHARVRMLIPPGKYDEVLVILTQLAQKTRFDQGCIECHVYRGEDCGILLDELWSDEESLHTHLRSADFLNVLLVSELSLAPPEFRIEKVLHSTGIEAIAKARNPVDTS